MVNNRLWVLGASDPEMAAIERLLRDAGETVAYATGPDGNRVHPGNAYRYDGSTLACSDAELPGRVVYQVECDYDRSLTGPSGRLVQIDHHRPGDPGYGKPLEKFLEASSIGQVVSALARVDLLPWDKAVGNENAPGTIAWSLGGGEGWAVCGYDGHGSWRSMVPPYIVRIAAADHCLEAAYRGRCPGVDPDALMTWRAEFRAAFQKRPVKAVLADIYAARKRLREAMEVVHTWDHDWSLSVCDGCAEEREFADLRGEHIPELPEAAAREGIPFITDQTDRDGRAKVVLMAAPPELVQRFLTGEIVPGLTEMYGDPARGFAGGYKK